APGAGRGGIRRARCAPAACRSRASGRWRAVAHGCCRGWCVIPRCCRRGRSARRTPSCWSSARRACARWAISSGRGARRCAWRGRCRSTSLPRPTATWCRNGGPRAEPDRTGGVSRDAPAAGRLLRWALLLAAAVLMVLRAPLYFSTPSFWAEEGTLYFAVAWTHALPEALTYRPAGYLLPCSHLATTLAVALVRGGILPLARAPLVTVLCAFAVQLVPVAVIAASRAPFWSGALRRSAGVAIILFGALTDEIWLNTINAQPWLTVAAALLLLEPVDEPGRAPWARTAVLVLCGLSAPAASALAPPLARRAWRPRTPPPGAHAAPLGAGAAVQLLCLWLAARSGQHLPPRAQGLALGVFAGTVWVRTLVVPTLGPDAAQRLSLLLRRGGEPGPLEGALLLALA